MVRACVTCVVALQFHQTSGLNQHFNQANPYVHRGFFIPARPRLATKQTSTNHISLDHLHKGFLVDLPVALVKLLLNVLLEVLRFEVTDAPETCLILNGLPQHTSSGLNGCHVRAGQ